MRSQGITNIITNTNTITLRVVSSESFLPTLLSGCSSRPSSSTSSSQSSSSPGSARASRASRLFFLCLASYATLYSLMMRTSLRIRPSLAPILAVREALALSTSPSSPDVSSESQSCAACRSMTREIVETISNQKKKPRK